MILSPQKKLCRSAGITGRVGNDVADELGVLAVRRSPTVVCPETPPWLTGWPETDWCLLELNRKGKAPTDLVSAVKHHVTVILC